MQVIGRRREIPDFAKFRHAPEAAVEVEKPAVIAAAEMREVAGLVDDQITPMRANIGQKPDFVIIIADQGQWFVEKTTQKSKRIRVTGIRHKVRVTDKLPGRGE